MAAVQTVTVKIRPDFSEVVDELARLRVLVSQVGFALDTAILALTQPEGDD